MQQNCCKHELMLSGGKGLRAALHQEALAVAGGKIIARRKAVHCHGGLPAELLGWFAPAGAQLPLYSFARRYAIKPKRIRSFGDVRTVPDTGMGGESSDSEDDKSFLDQLLLAEVSFLAEAVMALLSHMPKV